MSTHRSSLILGGQKPAEARTICTAFEHFKVEALDMKVALVYLMEIYSVFKEQKPALPCTGPPPSPCHGRIHRMPTALKPPLPARLPCRRKPRQRQRGRRIDRGELRKKQEKERRGRNAAFSPLLPERTSQNQNRSHTSPLRARALERNTQMTTILFHPTTQGKASAE